MNINLLLSRITFQAPSSITPAITTALNEIKVYSEKNFSDIINVGKAALNRRMLLDPYITHRLSAEVIHYIFTHSPDSNSQLQRRESRTALAEVISYGLVEGLFLLKSMPNNGAEYDYQEQKTRYQRNTLSLIKNIWQASIGLETALDEALFQNFLQTQEPTALGSLTGQLDQITAKIDSLKTQRLSNALLAIPSWTADNMREQVGIGFTEACRLVACNVKTETMSTFCKKFLSSSVAPVDKIVSHYFYDRAHLEAAIEQDSTIQFKDGHYQYRHILREMLTLIDQDPSNYSETAKEQFHLRLMLVENDLKNRFTKDLMPPELNASASSAAATADSAIPVIIEADQPIVSDESKALITLNECIESLPANLPLSTEISDTRDLLFEYADAIKAELPILSSSIEKLCFLVQKNLASQDLTHEASEISNVGERHLSILLNSYEFSEQVEFNRRNNLTNTQIKPTDLYLLLRHTVNFLVTPSSDKIEGRAFFSFPNIKACLEEIESGKANQKKLMDTVQKLCDLQYPPREIALTAEEASIIQTMWTLIEKLRTTSSLPLTSSSAMDKQPLKDTASASTLLDLSGFGSDGSVKEMTKTLSVLEQKKLTQKDRLPLISDTAIKDMLKGKLDLVALHLGENFLIAVEEVITKTDVAFTGLLAGNPMKQNIRALYEKAKSALPTGTFGDRLLFMYTSHTVYFSKLNAILRDETYQGDITEEERELAVLLHVAQLKAGLDKKKGEMQEIPGILHRGDRVSPIALKQKYNSLRILQETGCLSLDKEQLKHLNIADFYSKKNISMTSKLSVTNKFYGSGGVIMRLSNPEKISHFYSMGDVNSSENEFNTRLREDVVLLPIRLYEKNGVMYVDLFAIHTDILLDDPLKYKSSYNELKQLIVNTILSLDPSTSEVTYLAGKLNELKITLESDMFFPEKGTHSIISETQENLLFTHMHEIMDLAVQVKSLGKLEKLNQKMSEFLMTFGQFKIVHTIPQDMKVASTELKNSLCRLTAFLKRWRQRGEQENSITKLLDTLVTKTEEDNTKGRLGEIMTTLDSIERDLRNSSSLRENFPKLSKEIQSIKSILKRINPKTFSTKMVELSDSSLSIMHQSASLEPKPDGDPLLVDLPPSPEDAEEFVTEQSQMLSSFNPVAELKSTVEPSTATSMPAVEYSHRKLQIKDLILLIQSDHQQKALEIFLAQNHLTIFTRFQGKNLLDHAIGQNRTGEFSCYFDKKSDHFLKQCFAHGNEQMDLLEAIAKIKDRYLTSVGMALQDKTSILSLAQKNSSKEAALLLKWLFVAHVKYLLDNGNHAEALGFFHEHDMSLFDKDESGASLLSYACNVNQKEFFKYFNDKDKAALCDQYQKVISMYLYKKDNEWVWSCFEEARSLLTSIPFAQLSNSLMAADAKGLFRKRKQEDDVVRAGLPSIEDTVEHLNETTQKVQDLIVDALIKGKDSFALDLVRDYKNICIFDKMPQHQNRTILQCAILVDERKSEGMGLFQKTFSPPSACLVDQYLKCGVLDSLSYQEIMSLLEKQYPDFSLLLDDKESVLSKLIDANELGSTPYYIKLEAFPKHVNYLVAQSRIGEAFLLLKEEHTPVTIFSLLIDSLTRSAIADGHGGVDLLQQAKKHLSIMFIRAVQRAEFLKEIGEKQMFSAEELAQLYGVCVDMGGDFDSACRDIGLSQPTIEKAPHQEAAAANVRVILCSESTFFKQPKEKPTQPKEGDSSIASFLPGKR